MLHRDQRTPFSDWWWTVDKLLLLAISALILGGVILSLAASPPVATRIGLDPFHFFGRHVLFVLPSFLVLIGVALVADGFQFHIPRGYIYFAMLFAAAVELFNVLARRNRRKAAR